MTALRLEIDIEGPVLSAGLSIPAYGIDSGFERDRDGCFTLPGTLVKGVVLHTLREISETAPDRLPADKLYDWLGRNTGDVAREDDLNAVTGVPFLEPARGKLRFGDLRLQNKEAVHLTRNAVDDETGSVRRGMLQILESPVAYGETGTFVGTLTLAGSAEEAAEIAAWIRTALQLAGALGAAKSAGFGHIQCVRCEPAEEQAPKPGIATDPDALAGDPIGYVLEFEEPVLVSSQAVTGNLFKSSEEIAGGVVKGALARAIQAAGRMNELEEALDRMVIRHAKPVLIVEGGQPTFKRPEAVPLSLFSVAAPDADDPLIDILDAADADKSPEEESQYPAVILFSPDWKPTSKESKLVRAQLGHTADFRHQVRTRTAIKGEVAAESQLFSRVALSPSADPDPETGKARRHVWVGEIARGKADHAAFAEILKIMQKGLPGTGKTGATAAVSFHKATWWRNPISFPGAAPDKRRWRIILESDALMHGPDAVFKHDEPDPEKRLNAQYRDYFAVAINHRLGADAVMADQLDLRFFARQRWVGGYQALRFPGKPGEYYPHLVTEAGSVFVLDAPKAAKPAIESFAARGLPLPPGLPKHEREYKRSPFVPQNGYGEVSIGAYFKWKVSPDA
jgi:hypothetical protein